MVRSENMKKLFAVLLAAVMLFTLTACGSGGNNGPDEPAEGEWAGTYDVKIWIADNAVELTKKQIADFNSSNEYGIVINAAIEAVSENDSADNMLADVNAGGDIFCLSQAQFDRLVQAGALSKLTESAAKAVTEANDAGIVGAAKSDEDIYAYPLSSDNGYLLYYDKSVIPDEDVTSLEKLIEDCEAANKHFCMELETSAWYLAGFFFGTGCLSDWTVDKDGNFVSVNDTFNSANGLIAAKGMKKLLDSPIHVSASGAENFANGAAVVVTGTWGYNIGKAILGDDIGAAALPSFTVDGKEYHIGSFNGCKLLGVKPQDDAVRSAVLHKLAQFLTDEERQTERFEELAWSPTNINAQASSAVQSNPGLVALFAQSPYSVAQGQIHSSWWSIAKTIADDVKAADNDEEIQAALDSYHDKLDSLFETSD